MLIWSDAKIPDRTAGILGTPDQAEAVYAALLAGAKLLEGAGCTVLAIPCNTSTTLPTGSRPSSTSPSST